MTEKPKPAASKPLPPVRYPFRPSLTYRIGQTILDWWRNRG